MTCRLPIAAAAVLAAVASAATAAPTDLPGDLAARRGMLPVEGVVTNPAWDHLPGPEDLSRWYPPLATMISVNGRAAMTCTVSAVGAVENCRVVAEAPANFGFGAAALAMAPLFHMQPRSLDGEAVGGAKVIIPVRFAMAPEFTGPPPAPPADHDTPALAMARRLVAALHQERSVRTLIAALQAPLLDKLDASDAGVQATKAAYLRVLDQSIEEALPRALDSLARTYAVRFTPTQLEQITVFMESPAGQAWTTGDTRGLAGDTHSAGELVEAMRFGVHRRFCAEGRCDDAAPPLTKAR